MSLDTIFSGDLNIDDPQIRQSLKTALPQLANDPELDQLQSLPAKYVKERLIPALSKLDDTNHKLTTLKTAIQTNNDLAKLVEDFTFTDLQTGIKPVEKSGEGLVGMFTTVGNFFKEISGIQDENERVQRLSAEIVRRANRIGAKFDQYVLRGDGMQYGDDLDWNGFQDDEGNIYASAQDGSKLHNVVEDMSRDKFVTAINSMVAQARNGTLQASFGGHVVSYATEEQKLGDILGRLGAIESGVDDVLPGLNQKGAEGVTKAVAGGILTGLSGFIDTVWGWPTLVVVGTTGLALYNADKLAADSLLRKIPVAKHLLRAPKTPTPAGGAPAGTPTMPKTPNRYQEATDVDFKPNDTNHKEYRTKMLQEIETLKNSTTPGITISAEEAQNRRNAFEKWNGKFKNNQISLTEYITRTNEIITGKYRIIVRDVDGTIQKKDSAKRAVEKSTARMGFGKQGLNASIDADNAAKRLLKGANPFVAQDLTGADITFTDKASADHYAKLQSLLKSYKDMQEYGDFDKKLRVEEAHLVKLEGERAAIEGRIITERARLPASAFIPDPSGALHPTTGMPIMIPEPTYAGIQSTITSLQSNLSTKVGEISSQNTIINNLKSQSLPWKPSAAGFASDINTQKTAIKTEMTAANVTKGGTFDIAGTTDFDHLNRSIDLNAILKKFATKLGKK